MAQRHYWPQAVCGLVMAYLCLAPQALSQHLIWLGTLGGNESAAYAVTNSGIVVGEASTGYDFYNAFRWVEGVMQNLSVAGNGIAWGVSADGSVVVGRSTDEGAFRWTALGGVQYLGGLGATDVSTDGSVVCGYGYFGVSRRAFLWTADTGLRELGSLGGGDSVARGISADGAVVVGDSNRSDAYRHAFRWTAGTGMQDLGTLGGFESYAHDVSADGSVVVGSSTCAGSVYPRAFRWTEGEGMQDLGTLGGRESIARAVSANGDVVVGDSTPAGGRGEPCVPLDTDRWYGGPKHYLCRSANTWVVFVSCLWHLAQWTLHCRPRLECRYEVQRSLSAGYRTTHLPHFGTS